MPMASTRFAAPRSDTNNTHGTGCTLSSAIAAGSRQGQTLAEAVRDAKAYVTAAIAAADRLASARATARCIISRNGGDAGSRPWTAVYAPGLASSGWARAKASICDSAPVIREKIRERRGVDVEEFRACGLAGETNIGERDRVAVAIAAGGAGPCRCVSSAVSAALCQCWHHLVRVASSILSSCSRYSRTRGTISGCEFAGDDLGNAAHAGAAARVARQQRRVRDASRRDIR